MPEAPSRDRLFEAALWLGLGVAFSPVLLELVGHWRAHPWARVSLVFPGLALEALRRGAAGASRSTSRPILVLGLGLAIGLELVAISGDALRLGRLAFVLGAVALGIGLGRAGWVRALVLVWIVPLPSTLLELASPALEGAWGRLVAAGLPGLEAIVARDGRIALAAGEARLPLEAPDGGLALAFALAGLGWYRAARRDLGGRAALQSALRAAGLFVPIQLGIVALAGALLVGGGARPAGFVLAQAGWLSVGLLAVHAAWPGPVPSRSTGPRRATLATDRGGAA
ncbi:MAG TPA: hypothetical protein PLW10_23770 [Myxococcota bacterium]|nr:hypothetical protein [Myxococcota bacterium]